jgi:hypothetical protein
MQAKEESASVSLLFFAMYVMGGCASRQTILLASIMSSDDPFSFLDQDFAEGDADDAFIQDQAPLEPQRSQGPSKKRRGFDPTFLDLTLAGHGPEEDPAIHPLKRPRLSSPKPVVVDEFETEAKREVPASAGLTGGVETGSRLELKHQVQRAHPSPLVLTNTPFIIRFAIKSLFRRGIIISQSQATFPLPK